MARQFDEVLLQAKNVNKIFGGGKRAVHAVKNVNFTIHKGEIISIVGESGSVKKNFRKAIFSIQV